MNKKNQDENVTEKIYERENESGRIAGTVIRQMRMSRGLTQEELAEKMHCSAQKIGKDEKVGISKIEVVQEYARVFNCSPGEILQGTYETEGDLGTIGREILALLVKHKGFITVSELSNKEYMFGLNDKYVTKEIVKLSNMGMCVREQYIDFYDNEIDGLFITAKGLIAVKNCSWNSQRIEEIQDSLPNVMTYELILGEFVNYQELLNARVLEKRVRNLGYCGSYRVDYMQWLHKEYHAPYYGETKKKHGEVLPCLPGDTPYFDLCYRMLLGLDNKFIEEIFCEYLFRDEMAVAEKKKDHKDKIKEKEKECFGDFTEILAAGNYGTSEEDCWKEFSYWAQEYFVEQEDSPFYSKTRYLFSGGSEENIREPWESEMQNLREYNQYCHAIGFLDLGHDRGLYEFKKEREGVNLTKPFAEKDMISFIKANYRRPETKEEKIFEETLRKLNEDYPETLGYYDEIPLEWKHGTSEAGEAYMNVLYDEADNI